MDRLIHWTNSLCGLSFCQIVNGSTMCARVCAMCMMFVLIWNFLMKLNAHEQTKLDDDFTKPKEENEKSGRLERCTANVFLCAHSYWNASSVAETPLFVSMLYSHFIQCGMMWKFNEHILVCAVQSSLYWELIDTGQTHSHTPTKVWTKRYALHRLAQKATSTIYRRNKQKRWE